MNSKNWARPDRQKGGTMASKERVLLSLDLDRRAGRDSASSKPDSYQDGVITQKESQLGAWEKPQ